MCFLKSEYFLSSGPSTSNRKISNNVAQKLGHLASLLVKFSKVLEKKRDLV